MLQCAITQHTNQLKNYTRITHENIHDMKTGGYVKYFNNNFDLKYGGIIIGFRQQGSPIDISSDTVLMTELVVLVKSSIGIRRISYVRNYIFYMKHRTTNDKLRTIFLKAIAD